MHNRNNRYKTMEHIMLIILAAVLILFITFLVASGFDITWLKTISAIVSILICLLSLLYLHLTGELLRQRSLWISTAFAAILVCTLFSLIFHFPCSKP